MPPDGLDPIERPGGQAEDLSPRLEGVYGELCKVENLQLAYTQITEESVEFDVDPRAWEAVEQNGIEKFLQQLGDDLRAQTYHPTPQPLRGVAGVSSADQDRAVIRDQVVQAALRSLLAPAFPSDLPCDPEPERAIQWLAGVIDKGLRRAFAASINGYLDRGRQGRLLERASRRIGDAEVIGLLKEILAEAAPPGYPPRGLLAPLLADIAFEGIDQILQQARALGREGNVLHLKCARLANELVVLTDHDPRCDWLLPAVQKRLREELSALGYDTESVEAQSVDLACGDPLRFLGFELRLVTARGGGLQVRYRRPEQPGGREVQRAPRRRRSRGSLHPLKSLRYVSGMGFRRVWWLVRAAYRKVNSVKVGWRHLPVTLFPVLLVQYGLHSPLPWICLALIFVCNWRWVLTPSRRALKWVRRHWLDVALAACTIGALVSLFLLLSDM